jgi:hypothetical protein
MLISSNLFSLPNYSANLDENHISLQTNTQLQTGKVKSKPSESITIEEKGSPYHTGFLPSLSFEPFMLSISNRPVCYDDM